MAIETYIWITLAYCIGCTCAFHLGRKLGVKHGTQSIVALWAESRNISIPRAANEMEEFLFTKGGPRGREVEKIANDLTKP